MMTMLFTSSVYKFPKLIIDLKIPNVLMNERT